MAHKKVDIIISCVKVVFVEKIKTNFKHNTLEIYHGITNKFSDVCFFNVNDLVKFLTGSNIPTCQMIETVCI